jgi:hypothetical protein
MHVLHGFCLIWNCFANLLYYSSNSLFFVIQEISGYQQIEYFLFPCCLSAAQVNSGPSVCCTLVPSAALVMVFRVHKLLRINKDKIAYNSLNLADVQETLQHLKNNWLCISLLYSDPILVSALVSVWSFLPSLSIFTLMEYITRNANVCQVLI